jgi:hypothetical protein
VHQDGVDSLINFVILTTGWHEHIYISYHVYVTSWWYTQSCQLSNLFLSPAQKCTGTVWQTSEHQQNSINNILLQEIRKKMLLITSVKQLYSSGQAGFTKCIYPTRSLNRRCQKHASFMSLETWRPKAQHGWNECNNSTSTGGTAQRQFYWSFSQTVKNILRHKFQSVYSDDRRFLSFKAKPSPQKPLYWQLTFSHSKAMTIFNVYSGGALPY